jgi:hypothetical protein
MGENKNVPSTWINRVIRWVYVCSIFECSDKYVLDVGFMTLFLPILEESLLHSGRKDFGLY